MKTLTLLRFPFALILVFLLNTAFIPPTSTAPAEIDKAVVKVDGKEIHPAGMIKMDRDDTILFEAEGLKPNSQVNFKVKKLGIRFIKDSYYVDESGKIKEILYIPNMKIKVKAFVTYFNTAGKQVDVKFKFRII